MNNEPLVLSGHRFEIGIRIEPERQTNGRVRAQRPQARYAKASAKRLNRHGDRCSSAGFPAAKGVRDELLGAC